MDKDAIERTSQQVRTILEAAEASAAETRAEAAAHVARVEAAATGLLARIEELERELGTLRDAVRGSVERLTAGPYEEAASEEEEDFAAAAPAVVDEADEPVANEPGARANGDEAGARLIAFNMALDGKPREETARYLAEHFALGDTERLLDDVYARAGK